MSAGNPFTDYLDSLIASYGGVYWGFQETSGSVAVASDTTYNGSITGCTVGQAGPGGNIPFAFLLDGANDFVDIHNAAFQALFDATQGAFGAFLKVSGAGVWTDGATRNAWSLRVDASNQFLSRKDNVNNRYDVLHVAGGTTETFNITPYSPTDWWLITHTWKKGGNGAGVFVDGVQQGAYQAIDGVWAGSLAAGVTCIGCGNTAGPNNVWDGYIAYPFLLTDEPASTELVELATLGGTA